MRIIRHSGTGVVDAHAVERPGERFGAKFDGAQATAAAALENPSAEAAMRFYATHGADHTTKFVSLVGADGLRKERATRPRANQTAFFVRRVGALACS